METIFYFVKYPRKAETRTILENLVLAWDLTIQSGQFFKVSGLTTQFQVILTGIFGIMGIHIRQVHNGTNMSPQLGNLTALSIVEANDSHLHGRQGRLVHVRAVEQALEPGLPAAPLGLRLEAQRVVAALRVEVGEVVPAEELE